MSPPDPKPFRKSSFSEPQNTCVEIAVEANQASLRDTKRRDGGTLTVGRGQFRSLLALVVEHQHE